jgi:hypothetical protein
MPPTLGNVSGTIQNISRNCSVLKSAAKHSWQAGHIGTRPICAERPSAQETSPCSVVKMLKSGTSRIIPIPGEGTFFDLHNVLALGANLPIFTPERLVFGDLCFAVGTRECFVHCLALSVATAVNSELLKSCIQFATFVLGNRLGQGSERLQ